MKLSILLNIAALASTFATPLSERLLRRQGAVKGSQPPQFITGSGATAQVAGISPGKTSNTVAYSSNWAGAVITAPPAGTTFNSVYGVFTVPTPSIPAGKTAGTYSASVWVGIDGDTAQNSILQTGIDVTATVTTPRNGKTTTIYSYASWYEWYPSYATDFSTSQFSFSAGDQISLNVTAITNSTGEAILTNLFTKKAITFPMTAPSAAADLAGKNAEWIVEDYQENGALVPFANFGTVTFSSCAATYRNTTKKGSVGPTNAQIIEIKGSTGTVLTTVTIPSSSEVRISYV